MIDPVEYPGGFAESRSPQEVTVRIRVDSKGAIDQGFHGDPVISASRADSVKWELVCPEEISHQVKFRVSDFRKYHRLNCRHPEHPFPHMGLDEGTPDDPIRSGPVHPQAGGCYYKSTWTVYMKRNGHWEESDQFDPHIIVHDGGDF